MDAEKEIANLKARMDYMEQIHPDITTTAPGVVHGVLRNTPFILLSIGLGILIAIIIVKNKS